MSENIIYKTCSKCKKDKSTDNYYFNKAHKNGFDNWCKNCRKSHSALYKNKNKEKANLTFKTKSKVKGTNEWFQIKWKALLQSAKKRGIEFELKLSDIREIYSAIDKPCPYCKQSIEKPSVDRKDNSIGYLPENCILICSICNILKCDVNKLQIKEIYKHLFGNVKPEEIQM